MTLLQWQSSHQPDLSAAAELKLRFVYKPQTWRWWVSHHGTAVNTYKMGRHVKWGAHPWTSMEVGLLGEGAAHTLDDHIGCVVACPDALLQGLLQHQLRQEACVGTQEAIAPWVTYAVLLFLFVCLLACCCPTWNLKSLDSYPNVRWQTSSTLWLKGSERSPSFYLSFCVICCNCVIA